MQMAMLQQLAGIFLICYHIVNCNPLLPKHRNARQLDMKLQKYFKIENDTCDVTEWSDWGSCHGSDECSERQLKRAADDPALNFDMDPADFDKGRVAMSILMEEQKEEYEDFSDCMYLEECPEYKLPKSDFEKKCINGLSGRYPCRNMHQLSYVNSLDLGAVSNNQYKQTPRGNDIWGWFDIVTGDEYAIMGLTSGTSFVRVTDPTKPEVLGFVKSHTRDSIWRDIKVVNDVAYIVSEASDHGMQLFDLRRLRGRTSDDFEYFKPDNHIADFGNAHNIVSNEETEYVYVVGSTATQTYFVSKLDNGTFIYDYDSEPKTFDSCKGGLIMYDVTNRLKPERVGCFSQDGYCHDAQCLTYRGPDTRYAGQEICFMYNEDSITIVDVTDKADPYIVSKQGYYGSGYTHQGWLTEDQKFLLMDDELDEENFARNGDGGFTRTLIWDVSNLENPVLEHIHISSEHSIDHNLYTKGNFIYQSNYAAGLRVLHLDEETYHMKEVAYFGVHPSSEEEPIFKGTWSNYPYFRSGAVGVTSKEFGLFLVQPNYNEMEKATQLTYGERRRYRRILKVSNVDLCPNLIETKECNPGC